MRRILALLILLAIPAVAQFGGPMGGMPPSAMQGGGLLPGRGGDPLWVAAGPTKPTLDFDFAGRKDLTDAVSSDTSLITFSRSAAQSPGTYVGADGLIHDAAVNLALYSEQFDNAWWSKIDSTVTANQAIAPDGKQTADKITATASPGRIRRTSLGNSTDIYSWSIWVKSATGSDVAGQLDNGGLDIATFTATNEWQRVEALFQTTGVINAQPGLRITNSGDSLYIWGGQFELADPATMQPTAYVHTTSQALAAPRFDHDPDFPYVENLLLYSEQLNQSGTWTAISAPVTPNAGTSPIGDQTADFVALTNQIYQLTPVEAGTYTFSIYARSDTGTEEFRLKSYSPADGNVSTSDKTATTEWQRFTHTFTWTGTGGNVAIRDPSTNATNNIYFWGAQLEKASSVGQYVKTTDQTRKSQGNLTTNLLGYSEMLATGWATNAGTPVIGSNVTTAPDGTETADRLSGGMIGLDIAGEAQQITYSIYAKEDAGDVFDLIVQDRFFVRITLGTEAYSPILYNGGVLDSVTFTDAGNGWKRIAVTTTHSALSTLFRARLQVASDAVFLWGAQVQAAPSAGPYVRTLSATRSISDANAESLGLLVEEQRANYFLRSEEMDVSPWDRNGGAGTVVTANVATAPDGTQTADLIADNPASANSPWFLQTVYPLAGQTVTVSGYVKKAGAQNTVAFWIYNNVNGGSTQTINLTDDWQRYEFTTTLPATATVFRAGFTLVPLDGIHVWGMQFEVGGFATSYAPTTSATQTRYADVAAVQDEDFATTNLSEYSESFNVGWGTGGMNTPITANAIVAPDGQTTADLAIESTFTGTHVLYDSLVTTAAPHTWSVYAKKKERTWIKLVLSTGAANGAFFNLDSGTVGTVDSGYSATIEDAGNGWYRCKLTKTTTAATHYTSVYLASDGSTTSYAGDGTSGVYLWGASLTATEYPVGYTTTRNMLEDSQDFERSTWVTVANGAAHPVVNNDFAQAPDGTNTADKIDFGDTSGSSSHYSLIYNHTTNLQVGQSYSGSFYAKAATASDVGKKIYGYFNTVINEFTLTADWQRFEYTDTATSSARNVTIGARGASSLQPAFSALVWGYQFEPGTTATDYVRTVDTVGKSYGFYEPTEGTVFVDGRSPLLASWTNPRFANFNDGGGSNVIETYLTQNSTVSVSAALRVVDGGATQALSTRTGTNAEQFRRFSSAYKLNDFGVTAEGNAVATDTSGTVPDGIIDLEIGAIGGTNITNGHIKRLTYWPRRQADSTLQVITQ